LDIQKDINNRNIINLISWLISLIPITLIFSNAISDIIVVVCSLFFIFFSIKKNNWAWLNENWVKIGLIIYFWLIITSFFAYDKDKIKLEKLRFRAKKAGVYVDIIEKKEISKFYKFFDCVVLDVPCSGSGAWSRNPQQKWRITQKLIDDLIRLQFSLLNKAKTLLKDNGKLIYITCSLLRSENESVIESFILKNPEFSIVRQKNYYPSEIGDGFYCAELLKNN